MQSATIQTPEHHDHHHHHDDHDAELLNRVKHLVADQIGSVINSTAFSDSIIGKSIEAAGVSLMMAGSARRPLHPSEYLVEPREYNENGDFAVIVGRRLFDSRHAFSLLVTYGHPDDQGRLGFNYTLFQENMMHMSASVFCTPEPALKAELERQIGAYFKPHMVGMSALWSVLTVEGKKDPAPAQPAPEPAEAPMIEVPAEQLQTPQQPVKYDPPQHPTPAQVEEARGTLDDMFSPTALD